jgi:hypothetical protein
MESISEALSTRYVTSKDFWSLDSKESVKIIDTNEDQGYNLIHYNVDSVNSSKPQDFIRRVRGLIVKDNKVLVESFGYTPTVVVSEMNHNESGDFTLIDTDLQTHNIPKNLMDESSVYPLLDGTLLRVWKHNGTIHISTHKKLNASKSHWGSSSTFTELFKKYTEKYFKPEDLFSIEDTCDNLENDKVVCHNFLLVDTDLLICSQVELGEKTGFVLYINSVNGSLPEAIEPLNVSAYEVKYTTETFFKMETLKNLEEQNEFIKYGFCPEEKDESKGEGVVIFQNDRMIKVVSKAYENRSKIVNNDPNIIHRGWTILTESMFPKSGEDDYLSKFPILPTPSNDDLKSIIESGDFSLLNSCKIISEENFILKNNLETRNLRLLNALLHYSKSLPLSHKVSALSCYNSILEHKSEVIKILCNDFDKYDQGLWGKPNARDLKVYERIQTIVKEAKKYAKTRYTNGERFESMNEKQLLKKFTKENIRNLINKEYGENMHKIVRVLITSNYRNTSDE